MNGQLLSTAGVIGINHHVTADPALRLPLIILEDGAHGIKHATGHEGVARTTLVKAGGPRTLKAQGVRIHLQDEKDMGSCEDSVRKPFVLVSLHLSLCFHPSFRTWLTTMRPLLASVE